MCYKTFKGNVPEMIIKYRIIFTQSGNIFFNKIKLVLARVKFTVSILRRKYILKNSSLRISTADLNKTAERIGRIIRNNRLDSKLSQKDLGQIIGVSSATISMIETGKNLPTLEQLIALSDYFMLSYDYLLSMKDIWENSDFIEVRELSKRDIEILRSLAEIMRSKTLRDKILQQR